MSNNKYKVLLVEDDENISLFISALLDVNDYQVICGRNYAESKTLYLSYVPDLVILDLGLPDKDGSNLLQFIRISETTPVIVLSARSDENEKVKLLDLGANDYITKPFGSAELLARIRTSLRNNRPSAEEGRLPGGKFVLGDLVIDYDSRQVFLSSNEIKFTQTEFNILAFLSEHRGKVMTYSSIIKAIWRDPADDGSIKKLQVNMANIRKKFGARPGEFAYIVNELGVGYRMSN